MYMFLNGNMSRWTKSSAVQFFALSPQWLHHKDQWLKHDHIDEMEQLLNHFQIKVH